MKFQLSPYVLYLQSDIFFVELFTNMMLNVYSTKYLAKNHILLILKRIRKSLNHTINRCNLLHCIYD